VKRHFVCKYLFKMALDIKTGAKLYASGIFFIVFNFNSISLDQFVYDTCVASPQISSIFIIMGNLFIQHWLWTGLELKRLKMLEAF